MIDIFEVIAIALLSFSLQNPMKAKNEFESSCQPNVSTHFTLNNLPFKVWPTYIWGCRQIKPSLFKPNGHVHFFSLGLQTLQNNLFVCKALLFDWLQRLRHFFITPTARQRMCNGCLHANNARVSTSICARTQISNSGYSAFCLLYISLCFVKVFFSPDSYFFFEL